MKLTLTIQMDNDAFMVAPFEEAYRIGKDALKRARDDWTVYGQTRMPIFDDNGNRVGQLVFDDETGDGE